MAKQDLPKISVTARPRVGSRESARLRKAGRLPVIIYGHKQNPLPVSCDGKEMAGLLHENTHVLEAVLDSAGQPCLVKDVQWNHLGNEILHVDLARVDLNERVEVEVQLEFIGDAIGLKETGAILERPVTSINVECLVIQIPERIKVDVANLGVGQAITVKDIVLPPGVTALESPETAVASIHIVAEEVVEVAPAEGAAAEPEIIGRKPEEGEGEEAAEGAAPAKKEAAKK